MRRLLRARFTLALVSFLVCAPLAGCGGGGKVGDIQDSEEVKAADESGQKAMEEFMRSQGKAQ